MSRLKQELAQLNARKSLNSNYTTKATKKQDISNRLKSNSAFTIVELLIVVVVIAILATVIIVAYTGISNRAHDASVSASLNNMQKTILLAEASGPMPDGG